MSKILAGVRIAFSTTAEVDMADVHRAAPVSFNKMKKAVSDVGGTVCPTVHKKVNFLVATESSLARKTQKIRKALKLNVCIVEPGFLEACIAAGKKVDHIPFTYPQDKLPGPSNSDDSETLGKGKGKGKGKEKGSLPGGSSHPAVPGVLTGKDILDLEIVIPMDCYCICHDSDKPYCDWCTEGHPELAPWPLCEPGAGDVVDAGCAAAVVDGSTEDANGSNVDDDDDDEEEAPMLVDISSAAAAAQADDAPAPAPATMDRMTHHWKEMYVNEQRYLQDLCLLVHIRDELKGKILDSFEVKKIFGGIDDLEYVTNVISSRMAGVNNDWDSATSRASDAFVGKLTHHDTTHEIVHFMCDYYEKFTSGHAAAKLQLEEVMKRKDVRQRMEELEAAPNFRRQKIKDLLMLPIQHMMRYTMHLKDMLKAIGTEHLDSVQLSKVIKAFESGMGTVNSSAGQHQANRQTAEEQAKAFQALRTFLTQMEGGETLLKAGRAKVAEVKCKEGKEAGSNRKVMLFLMNDSVIVAERKSSNLKVSGTLTKAFGRKGGHKGSFSNKQYKKELLFQLANVKVARQTENDFKLEWVGSDGGSSAKHVAERDRILTYQYSTTHVDDLVAFCRCLDVERAKNGLAETGAGDMVFEDAAAPAAAAAPPPAATATATATTVTDDDHTGLLNVDGAGLDESMLGVVDHSGSSKRSTSKKGKAALSKVKGFISRGLSNVGMTTPGIKHRLRGSRKESKENKQKESFKKRKSGASVKRSASNVSQSSRGSKKRRGGSNKSTGPPNVIHFEA